MNYNELMMELDTIEELLQEASDKAIELASRTQGVFAGQLKQYLAATLNNFISSEYQPGSIFNLKNMVEKCM